MFGSKIPLSCLFSSCKSLLKDRLSAQAVRLNAQSHLLSYRLYNNFLIGKNYLATVGQYVKINLIQSKCYFCKLPFAKPVIRKIQGMNNVDTYIHRVNSELFKELPSQLALLRRLALYLKYPGKNLHSSLGLVLGDISLTQSQVKWLAAIEAVTLGFQLHHSVGGSFNPNPVVRIGLALLRKVIKDKYLVLAGDYLHIRGSVLASEIGVVELPHYLSESQIALCKQVYLRDQLRKKIEKEGYQAVTIEEIHEISRLRASLTTYALKGIDILQDKEAKQELFESIGLLVLYRRELEEFMFNFPRIFNRFLQIKTGNGIYWEEYKLTQYLFYQSTQKTGIRLDLAYLNTVQLLTHQISLLQSKIQAQLSHQQYKEFTQRVRYILMMYS